MVLAFCHKLAYDAECRRCIGFDLQGRMSQKLSNKIQLANKMGASSGVLWKWVPESTLNKLARIGTALKY